MISLENNELVFRFEDVHPKATYPVGFQRTLRIPDDGKHYPLPAGMGSFTLLHLDDFADKLPVTLSRRGGVIMPMWQSEALWLRLGSTRANVPYPFALKIAAGKINALTGEPWQEQLQAEPQDYVVVPEQPWLDGFCVKQGVVRQFVAAPLGEGSTVEEQINHEAVNGGLQIIAYPMKSDAFECHLARRLSRYSLLQDNRARGPGPLDMGLAAGGKMNQEVYADPHGVESWDQMHHSRCFITILNAQAWHWLTSSIPQELPPSMVDYQKYGLPWFDYYSADQAALTGSNLLAQVKSIETTIPEAIRSRVRSLGPDQRPVRETDAIRESNF